MVDVVLDKPALVPDPESVLHKQHPLLVEQNVTEIDKVTQVVEGQPPPNFVTILDVRENTCINMLMGNLENMHEIIRRSWVPSYLVVE